MFIQTEAMPDATRMKFYPGEPVLSSGVAEFVDEEAAERSPLATLLFNIEGVNGAIFYDTFITIIRDGEADWQVLKPMILGAIMDHYASGQPILLNAAATDFPGGSTGFDIQDDPADSEIIAQIQDLMGPRIKPAAEQMGGDVIYKAYQNGTVYVEFIGPTNAIIGGMTNVISHYIPEVQAVKDYRDAIPKPGLDTPIGKAIQVVLDEKVNPAVAGHGGHISLIDVKGDTAFIRLEGGCQGCGMADATLKQGVEVEIKSAVPEIISVLDVTDHAGGANPYYSAG